jgi:hypothetical protein
LKKYFGITEFQLGRLYRIEKLHCTHNCFIRTGFASECAMRKAAPLQLMFHHHFRGATWLSRENFTGELLCSHYFNPWADTSEFAKMESQNGLESPEDRRSALWHGNQYVCERHPQVSGW